ncbi:hypothetical protein NQ318_012970 [Aromia moschata]|uniref:Uncharacterized protein n=1 Tax=Aromia moschata TaxID=1265417 RepID=A0AAV8XRC0_9CUCU|nr:hypothetical protein NQ318_012970 [Aromia moschata]
MKDYSTLKPVIFCGREPDCITVFSYRLDLREIQRQNQITTQILQNYLEKRLFGNNRSSRPPSVWDILPRARRKPVNNIQEAINGTKEEETLQSVESETVSAYEDFGDEELDENKGKIFCFASIDQAVSVFGCTFSIRSQISIVMP